MQWSRAHPISGFGRYKAGWFELRRRQSQPPGSWCVINHPPILSQAGFTFNFDKFAFLCTACSSFWNRRLLHYRRWVLDLIPQQHKSSDILEIFIGWSMKTQRQDPLDLNSNFVVTHGKLIETHDIFVFIVFIIDKDWPDRAITLFCLTRVILLNKAHFVLLKWSTCSFFFFEVFATYA